MDDHLFVGGSMKARIVSCEVLDREGVPGDHYQSLWRSEKTDTCQVLDTGRTCVLAVEVRGIEPLSLSDLLGLLRA
jgi:hypothetical protein